MKPSTISMALFLWILGSAVCYGQVPARQEFFFPQLVNGESADGNDFNTVVTLKNPNTAAAEGTLEVFAGDGSPLTITFEDLFGNVIALPSIDFTIPAKGIFQIKTAGTQEGTIVGYAKVTADRPIGGTLVFLTEATATGEIISQAGVEPTGVVQEFAVIDHRGGGSSSGLAIVNSENNETQITLTEFDPSGNQLDQVSFNLGPFEHQAFFFSQRLANVPEGLVVGFVTVASSNTKVAAVALKWDSTGGEDKFTLTPILQTN